MNAENKSQKVQRWKLHCQEFDFKVEHIPGEENIEADGFSRLEIGYPQPYLPKKNFVAQGPPN